MSIDNQVNTGRRAFLGGGALVVAFSLLPSLARAEFNGMGVPPVANPKLAGSLQRTPMLDAWIRIAPDGRVTVCSGKVELGTGVRTALMQVACEQLALPLQEIQFIAGDTDLTPNEGFTAGSHTMADSGTALLHASAQVATLLREGAARRWGVAPRQVRLREGRAVGPGGRSMHFGEAIAGITLRRAASEVSELKPPVTYSVIGKAVPRVDIPAKVTGGQAYVQDLRLPGMLHARVVRPPRPGAKLAGVDVDAVRKMKGAHSVVRNGDYLAVIAAEEWHAIQAMYALTATAKWEGGATLPGPGTIHDYLQRVPSQDEAILQRGGALRPGLRTVRNRYTRQYVLHGSIGPSCAVAHLDVARMTVWTHSQGVFPLRQALAEMLAMKPDAVHCIHAEGSGCYGQNGADDVAADAALLAREVPGRPIRVQLMREQENLWEPFAPAMVSTVVAALGPDNRIDYWQYEVWSGSHNERPGNAGKLLPAQMLARPFVPSPSLPMPQPEGGGDRNALPLYEVPNIRVVNHFLPVTPLRTSAMRSLGAHLNILAIESTMDQLAALARVDTVQFRLAHLAAQPRAQAVIRSAAHRFGWSGQQSARPGHGIGFGFGQYKNTMAYVAIAIEIFFDEDKHEVHVLKVSAAADCGQVVNPDGARNQLEGGIIQSTSWTLLEALRYGEDGVKSFDWATYPILRFSGVPRRIDIALLDQPGQPFLGVAEAAQGPMAAALANAFAHAAGKRALHFPLLAAS
ncbi:molybdopterin-dependent oxidoreductase [Massilia dura]|uniref:Molybdopterin-dependent oxidoreductase n=1 Tax=Pseudoduganella dura TaxID=321982 RepID=A0A6I3XM90_9BURK|nr:molybdopterin cofactor-binding domain-containing protein [Pseudoduganella dura]MUI13718.1 molybdopterin-dependent oxidoreductase [Pseudoduganella dura]GGX74919.1 aldehyde dehydrogenase [Pseudoduganella dura]